MSFLDVCFHAHDNWLSLTADGITDGTSADWSVGVHFRGKDHGGGRIYVVEPHCYAKNCSVPAVSGILSLSYTTVDRK